MADQVAVDDVVLQEIAAELAREIYPLPDILARFGLPYETFEKVKKTHHFQRMHAEALITWQSSLNARERTKLKSEVMLEKMLEPGWHAFRDPQQPLAAKVAFMTTVAKIAGMLDRTPAEGGTAVAPGDRVSITINLSQPPPRYANGEHARTIVIDKQSLALPPSDPVEEAPGNPGITDR